MSTSKHSLEHSATVLKLSRVSKVLMGVGFLSSLLFFISLDRHHFYYSYLFSFSVFATISLGAMFFVIIQFLTRAGWSVVVRRVAESLMANIGVLFVLFIPVLFGLHELYHWTHEDVLLTDHIIQGKVPYLNIPFFVIRSILFFIVWIIISKVFFSKSELQDYDADPKHTAFLWRNCDICLY
jgi:hypothetical protein